MVSHPSSIIYFSLDASSATIICDKWISGDDFCVPISSLYSLDWDLFIFNEVFIAHVKLLLLTQSMLLSHPGTSIYSTDNIPYVNIPLTRALDRFTRKRTVRLQTDRPVTSLPSVSRDVIHKEN